jgi:cellulose synthase/poly-beta-1,6-N-acetylglucosamine synthase-like glycosyltransferase
LFWFALGALIYIYIGYPLLLAVIGWFSRPGRANLSYTPRLSVLIAAYNEELSIQKKIEDTLGLDYPAERLEILILSDGSTDRTDAIVHSFANPRVRLLRIEGRKGKTNAQNEGVAAASGEVLVFSDATTVYHPQALRFLASNYSDPAVGAVSGRYQYFDPAGNSPTGLGSVAFWNYENFIKTAQSRIRTITGCCGCIYSVRRPVYSVLSPDIISDLVQPLHVIRKGYRVVFEHRALAFEETTQSTSEEFSMRVRVVTRGIRGMLSVPDLLKPWMYPWISLQLWSHKALRWLVPFFMMMLLLSNFALWNHHQYQYRLFLSVQVFFYLLSCLSAWLPIHRTWRLLGIPLYFCILNAAALVSVIEVLRGKKYTTWRTVRTQI